MSQNGRKLYNSWLKFFVILAQSPSKGPSSALAVPAGEPPAARVRGGRAQRRQVHPHQRRRREEQSRCGDT